MNCIANPKRVINKISVTNDTAERVVGLMHEYNRVRTKSKEQIPFILQVGAEHCRMPPLIKKKPLFTK